MSLGLYRDLTSNVYAGFSYVQSIDQTPPIITVNPQSVSVTVGTAYTDTGVTATDNADGDLTESVIVTGSVNTSIAGTYTLTYQVTDSNSNQTTVQRVVTVNAAGSTTAAETPVISFTKVLSRGAEYADEDLLASDSIGSVDIDWSGDEVNTLTPGTYTRTATAENDAGITQINFLVVVSSNAWTIQ